MYNKISNEYDRYFGKSENDYKADCENLISNSGFDRDKKITVLDYGCGTGSHALQILKKTNWEVICFDVSNEMLSVAEEKLKKYSNRIVLCSNINEVFDKKFDLAYSLFFVINHITKKDDLKNTLDFLKLNSKRSSIIYIDLYRESLLALDPPRNYSRLSSNIRKTATVSKINDHFEIKYQVNDLLRKHAVCFKILIKGWSAKQIADNLDFKILNDMKKDFTPSNGDEYQHIIKLGSLNE